MQALTENVFAMMPPGGVFNMIVVRNLFPDISEGARRLLVDRALRAGEIKRLKPGLYILDRIYRKSELHPFSLASLLHFPSHISLPGFSAHSAGDGANTAFRICHQIARLTVSDVCERTRLV
jgi:hypothetical protein